MLGAALTPLLWTVIGWAYIGYAWFFDEPILWYDWFIIGGYTVGSLVYVAVRCCSF
ncbi:hypothetical protein ACNO5E_23590 [Vibrio parahaemolyticus]|nr:hypothetical protein [Vibrio parahaemolyticus]